MDYKPKVMIYSCSGVEIKITACGCNTYTCQFVGEHCLSMAEAREVGKFLINLVEIIKSWGGGLDV